jgi:hypothetical protein
MSNTGLGQNIQLTFVAKKALTIDVNDNIIRYSLSDAGPM